MGTNLEKALKLHEEWHGKIEVNCVCPVKNGEDLSFAYTPGVAEPCKLISKDPDLSYKYTRRWNMVAVVTDGSAVLGLGDIGPEAGMPVPTSERNMDKHKKLCKNDTVAYVADTFGTRNT
jgi:malate dehydrogenase (oxaloacetate-decarboxylating)